MYMEVLEDDLTKLQASKQQAVCNQKRSSTVCRAFSTEFGKTPQSRQLTVDQDLTAAIAEIVVHPVLIHSFNIYTCLIMFDTFLFVVPE